jgi:ribonuclease-3
MRQDFYIKIFDKSINSLPSNDDLKDSKTKLQELLQSHNCDLPEYDTKK